MGFIDHIQACNNHDLEKFVPFLYVDGQRIGWILKENVHHLASFKEMFEITKQNVKLKPSKNFTAAMSDVTRTLCEKGLFMGWREELYRVAPRFGDAPLFLIERSATPFFGLKAYGVHINGFVREASTIKMWIAKRADDRIICPGMWDNMVAGGQPANLSVMENIIKECQEEAAVGEELARQAKPVGSISYLMETDGGIKPDVMFCYDLEVPQGFVPNNTDGEVGSFHLMDVEEVAEIVRTTFDFKFNCNLVVIDFLIRHGVLGPDDTPDYEDLVQGLHR